MEQTKRDVIVNTTIGFPTVADTINHLNAPPLRADKAERLMEFTISANGGNVARMTIPNTRTNQCIMEIDGVVKHLRTIGFYVDYMNFEESDAFHSTDRSKNFTNQCYSDLTSGSFTLYDRTTNLPSVIATISYKTHNRKPYYAIKLVGEETGVMSVRDYILANHTVKKPVQASVKIASAEASGQLTYTESHEIHKNPQIATHAFYPWMVLDTADLSQDALIGYLKEYLESNSSILILIGPPGTGKSTLIRTLISQFNVKATMAYTAAAITHPSFIKDFVASLESDDEENDIEVESRQPSILVMEDSDDFIRTRDKGNQLMAEFLNTADGIASSKLVKMVFSTNLPSTRDIDVALMRPGRCFDVLPFRFISADEAHWARDSINLKEKEFDPNASYSLAEALNTPSRHGTPEMVKPRFGFNS